MVRRSGLSNVLRSFAYQYNAVGMMTNVVREDGSTRCYGYDGLDRLTSETAVVAGGETLYSCGYGYDAVGNRTNKTAGATTVTYALPSGNNRLSSWAAASGDNYAGLVRVDVLGHSTENIGTNPALGQLYISNVVVRTPAVSETNFTAAAFHLAAGNNVILAAIGDAAGNVGYAAVTVRVDVVTGASYAYSAAGCLTNILYSGSGFSNTLALAWNGRYELASVRTNGALAETYGYDALGRRVTISSGGTTNWFVYDGVHVVAEVNGSGQMQKSYAWGPGIDNLLAFTDYTGGETNTYYALTDHLGTVHALADETGAIVESYRYDAWGKVLGVYDASGAPLANHQSAIGNSILWQGREYSWNTGLYYFRARWYDPVTGHWLSNDPIGISGGLNQYVFCGSNPVNCRDPDGLLARLTLSIDGKILTIEIPVVWTGAGATETVRTKFINGIQDTWSKTYGSRQVNVKVVSPKKNWGRNTIDVPLGGGPANVDALGNAGTWPAESSGWVAAHEAGHLMGLADRYYGYNGLYFGPHETYEKNIMGATDMPSDIRNIAAIVSRVSFGLKNGDTAWVSGIEGVDGWSPYTSDK